jgi:uncharacterized protein (TIGR03000 family)
MKTCTIKPGQIIQIDIPWKTIKTEPEKKNPINKEEEPKPGPNTAIIEIKDLPTNAKIWVDDKEVRTKKWYKSPDNLDPTKTYFYMIKIEINKDGKVLTDAKKVEVQAGKKTVVNFNLK